MATINVNLSAVHDGRGREEYADHRLRSGMSDKVSDPKQRRALGVKSFGRNSHKYVDRC